MYTYDWLILMYGRNQPSIVKQLSSNLNKQQQQKTHAMDGDCQISQS